MIELLAKHKTATKWVVAIVLVLILLPELLRYGLVRVLLANDIGQASIDDVDLNLFTGEFAVKQLEIHRDSRSVFSVDSMQLNVAWSKLLFGQIHLQTLLIEQPAFSVLQTSDGTWQVVVPLVPGNTHTESGLTTGSDALAGSTPPASTWWGLALSEMVVRDAAITVQTVSATGMLQIDRLQLHDLSSTPPSSPTLTVNARWGSAPITLVLDARPFAPQSPLHGELAVDRFALASVAGAVGHDIEAAVTAQITFDALRQRDGDIQASLNTRVTVDQLVLPYGPLLVNNHQLSWRGDVFIASEHDQLTYHVQGDLQTEGLSVEDSEQQLSLLGLEQLSASGLSLKNTFDAVVKQLSIRSIDFVSDLVEENTQPKTTSFHADNVLINDVSVSEGRHLVVDTVKFAQTQAQVSVQKGGHLQLISVLESVLSRLEQYHGEVGRAGAAGNSSLLSDNAEVLLEEQVSDVGQAKNTKAQQGGTDNKAPDPEPFTVVVNAIDVQAGSQLTFQDLRFTAPVKQRLLIDELTITGIDQRNVDKQATVTLRSRIDEFASAELKGSLSFFADNKRLALTGSLQSFALPSLSPYSETYLGYHLATGQYDHKFDLTVDDGELQLQNQLLLRGLTLSAVAADKPQPLQQQLDIPLEFALDMLRDSDDTISLDVPVTGSLDDPQITLSSIVSTALGGALKSSASSYLKLAIQPYGVAVMAAQWVGEQASAISLEPLIFANGQSELTEAHRGYLAKLSSLLRERPKLTIKLCGQASTQDSLVMAASKLGHYRDSQLIDTGAPKNNATARQQAQAAVSAPAIVTEQELVELAESRAVLVKRVLVDSGVDATRVFTCQPQFHDKAVSGVVMAM